MSGADNVGKACAPEHAGTGQGRPSFDPDPVPCPGWGIEAFLDAVYGGAKPSRRYRHREVLLDMDRLLDHKIGLSPLDIGYEDVECILYRFLKGCCGLMRLVDLLGYLDEYLVFYGNSVVRDTMNGPFAKGRGYDEYLDEAEYLDLMGAPKTPTQDVVVHLQAFCGLRTIECSRLRLCDLHMDSPHPHIVVRGNSVRDDRAVALDKGSISAITRWMLHRPGVAEAIRLCHIGWEDPGTLLLQTDPRHQSWKGGKWDSGRLCYEVMGPLAKALGFRIGSRVLRATFARRALESGMDVDEVTRALGYRTDCWMWTWGLDAHRIALQRAIRARGAGSQGGSA